MDEQFAPIVVAKWEGALDETGMRQLLDNEPDAIADEPEKVLPPPEPLVRQPAAAGGHAS